MIRVCLLATLFLMTNSLWANEPLYENGFSDPDQIEPLVERFESMHVSNGALRVEHQRGHAASPTLPVRFSNGVLNFRFKLADADRLICRFEDESRVKGAHSHLCRLEIRPTAISLRLDQPPKDRDYRETTLFETHRQNFVDGNWHTIQLEFAGPSLTAVIDGTTTLEGRHDHIAHEKLGVIFVVQKGVAFLDDVSLNGEPKLASSEAGNANTRGMSLFQDYIEPMFKQYCFECHSHEFDEANGGLVVDSRSAILKGGDLGPALIPGNPDGSLLVKALEYEDIALQMPPDGKLDEQTITYVREWIGLGAPDPRKSIVDDAPTPSGPDASKLWSVQPLIDTSQPDVTDSNWSRSAIDRYILYELESNGLNPSPDADPEVLVRRLHYVLTGLPPTIDESTSFIEAANQDIESALETRIDDLLARPQFGERWGRHWLDIARYADASGTTAPRPFKQAWRYRDYVIHAFNSDKRWDEFVRQQIAGDLIGTESNTERAEGLVATGFLALTHVLAATRDPETLKMDTIDEQLDVVGKTFLGVAIGCARCHDHKLDPFPTRDYYSLAGVFRSTASYTPSVSQESLTLDGAELDSSKEDIVPWLRGGKGVKIHSVKDAEDPRDEPIHLRGEVEITGEIVERGFPTLVSQVKPLEIPDQSSGREQLADWILNKNNSLAWRVIVNRVWHHAFGQGIVRSTDNFGFTGDPPSHPELLDHLALSFRQKHHGSFKSLVREILLSRTWRQSSKLRIEAFDMDPGNRLLWRVSPRRMEAEAVIDSIQFVCGTLNLSPPTTSVVPEFRVGNQGSTSNLVIADDTLKRRAVYWPVFRKDVPIVMDVLGIFDFPPATAPRGTREVTRVPSQSLALLNNPFVIDSARKLQKSLLSNPKLVNDRDRIRILYQKLYCRVPTADEEARTLIFLDQFSEDLMKRGAAKSNAVQSVSWNRLCHTLLVSNEFIVIP